MLANKVAHTLGYCCTIRLAAAQLTKDDVTIVWTKDLTGPQGAAELFRKDSFDRCLLCDHARYARIDERL